jgi:hypothetical protein
VAVYRCTVCGHIDDLPLLTAGEKAFCGNCEHPTILLDTALLIQSLVTRHGRLMKERDSLKTAVKQHLEAGHLGLTGPTDAIPLLANPITQDGPSEFQPLIRRLRELGIKSNFDKSEQGVPLNELKVAAMIVEHAAAAKPHLEHICHAYKQGWMTVNLNLQMQDVTQRSALTRLTFELYASGYFVNYASDIGKASLALGMHPAPNVRKFFDAGWLELWLYFQIVRHCQLHALPFSGARMIAIDNPGTTKPLRLDFAMLLDQRELVVVALCTNDHRLEVDRLRSLHRQFDKNGCTFIICDPFSDEIRAAEMSIHYGLPFSNLDGAVSRLQQAVSVAKNPFARLTQKGGEEAPPPRRNALNPYGSLSGPPAGNVVPFTGNTSGRGRLT